MQIRPFRVNITYELSFERPVFAVARSNVDVLKALYDAVAPRYPIAPDHMRAMAGQSLADVGVRMGLLNNQAELELRVDRMALRTMNIRTADDLAVAKDLALLVHGGLQAMSPEFIAGESRISAAMWLIVEGGMEAADRLLTKFGAPRTTINPKLFQAELISYPIRSNLENRTERWNILISLENSAIAGAELFLAFDVRFRSGGRYSNVKEQIEFCEETLPKVLEAFDLKAQNVPEAG